MIALCPSCGQNGELDEMDFGPYLGQNICADCWATACDKAWEGFR